jgi:hypothetical protein
MKCREFQSQYKQWIAGETDEPAADALEAHASQCEFCQAFLNTEEFLSDRENEDLRTALVSPQAAARVADRVIDRLATPHLLTKLHGPQRKALSVWLVPLLTLVAGFLLAMWVLPGPEKKVDLVQPPVAPPAAPIPVAHFVAATGPVEMFDKHTQVWTPIDQDKLKMFACPTDTRVRTTADVRCELQTGEGCVIRLNDQTEVTLRGSSSIELAQGQVWCRSPRETKLEVRVTSVGGANQKQPKAEQPSLWSVGPSCVMTGIQPAGSVQVVNAEGEINLRTATGDQRLDAGQVAEISNGEITTPSRRVDPLLSTRWMQPLLVQRGPDDAELKQRVDTLLAQIGQSKIATLYEQEIRSLGEHAVLPLVRFIQSPLAEKDPTRRTAAMELTSDLAPVWLIPDLIDLLAHTDPFVRRQAAATLFRLTALNMNLSPDDWREQPNDAQAAALMEWRNWWAAHREHYPAPHLQITRE